MTASSPAEATWLFDSGRPGPTVAVSFGVHGNERPPIDAGQRLVRMFAEGELSVAAGRLLLIHANPRASEEDQRWSQGGVDLNRCFHPSVLGREPELHEEHRARAVAAALEETGAEVLVDFHCTVEPGRRFLMQHPPAGDAQHGAVYRFLAAEVLLTDPRLNFGGVSLDEYMSTRGRVGICYETGWIGDPANTPEFVLEEMRNLLAGLGVLAGEAAREHGSKELLELGEPLSCSGQGFRWSEGVGENLQALPAGTVLGRYGDGREERLAADATLIFPKKKPELVQVGKPLVQLATRVEG